MSLLASLATLLLALPGFSYVSSGPAGGTLFTGIYPGSVRPGFLYLPPHFAPARRYPVVYLLHGMRGSPSEFPNGTNLVRFADGAISTGRVRPFLAVMPAAGPSRDYNGEWAGAWERMVVRDVVPFVDAHLPAIRSRSGRILAGLSAGGYGAADIGLRHPGLFGTIEGWGGYYRPLRDGPFKRAGPAALRAHDPLLLAPREAAALRRDGTRFFLSTGPAHSHWFTPAETFDFARELRGLGLRVATDWHPDPHGEWSDQLAAGLTWALATTPAARAASGSGATSAGP